MRWVVLLLALTPAFAGIVYDNGAPNGQNGNEMTAWIQAEDFVLAGPVTVTDVTFWDMEQTGTSYQGSIFWQIYSDNAGSPGSVLFSGSATPTRTSAPAAALEGFTGMRNDFSVGSIALSGGTTYWLGLHNGPLSTTDRLELYWSTTNSNATASGHEQFGGSGGWSGNGQEHAFNLSSGPSVPEPASLLLLGAGLLGLGLIRRR